MRAIMVGGNETILFECSDCVPGLSCYFYGGILRNMIPCFEFFVSPSVFTNTWTFNKIKELEVDNPEMVHFIDFTNTLF